MAACIVLYVMNGTPTFYSSYFLALSAAAFQNQNSLLVTHQLTYIHQLTYAFASMPSTSLLSGSLISGVYQSMKNLCRYYTLKRGDGQ